MQIFFGDIIISNVHCFFFFISTMADREVEKFEFLKPQILLNCINCVLLNRIIVLQNA